MLKLGIDAAIIEGLRIKIEAITDSYNQEIEDSIEHKKVPFFMKKQLRYRGEILIESNNNLKGKILKVLE